METYQHTDITRRRRKVRREVLLLLEPVNTSQTLITLSSLSDVTRWIRLVPVHSTLISNMSSSPECKLFAINCAVISQVLSLIFCGNFYCRAAGLWQHDKRKIPSFSVSSHSSPFLTHLIWRKYLIDLFWQVWSASIFSFKLQGKQFNVTTFSSDKYLTISMINDSSDRHQAKPNEYFSKI